MGESAAASSGVKRWADIGTKNSERDTHRVVRDQGSKLDIPIDEMNVQGEKQPWISPKAWLQYIVSHGLLYMLSGLQFEDRHLIGTTWKQFWQQFQPLYPDFGIFDDLGTFDPAHTIAMYLHGDEGRTLKRSAVMVTSLQSVLGIGFNKKRLKRPRGANDLGKLWANFAGHTFTTRFVLSVIGKKNTLLIPVSSMTRWNALL